MQKGGAREHNKHAAMPCVWRVQGGSGSSHQVPESQLSTSLEAHEADPRGRPWASSHFGVYKIKFQFCYTTRRTSRSGVLGEHDMGDAQHVRRIALNRCERRHPDYFDSMIVVGPASEQGFGPPCDECLDRTRKELAAKRAKAHGKLMSPDEVAALRRDLGISEE